MTGLRRWGGYLAVVIVFAVACGLLSWWQWSRRAEAVAEIDRVTVNYDAQPVAIDGAKRRAETRAEGPAEHRIVREERRTPGEEILEQLPVPGAQPVGDERAIRDPPAFEHGQTAPRQQLDRREDRDEEERRREPAASGGRAHRHSLSATASPAWKSRLDSNRIYAWLHEVAALSQAA